MHIEMGVATPCGWHESSIPVIKSSKLPDNLIEDINPSLMTKIPSSVVLWVMAYLNQWYKSNGP